MNTRVTAQRKPKAKSARPAGTNFLPRSETDRSSRIPAVVDDVLNSPGQPLEAATREFMEPRFGHHFSRVGVTSTAPDWGSRGRYISRPGDSFEQEADRVASAALRTEERAHAESSRDFDFSAVRIHTNPTASESARAMNAHAYTVGSHIVFGQGKFEPKSTAGRALLAHELAHVGQVPRYSASEKTTASRTLPIFRQRGNEAEDFPELDWLAAYPPIVMDDNAPVLIAWAREQAVKFEDPATRDERRHYLAQGLLKVRKQLHEFEGRAKRNPQGALVYTDMLKETQTPWTEDGAESLDSIDPFMPSNIAEWKIAAKSPRAAAQLGKRKAAEKEKSQKQAERPEPRRDAEKVTFRKKKGMTFKTLEGQQQIAFYLMATIQNRSSMDEVAWAVSQIDLSKWWAPPTGGDLPTWQQEFEATDVDKEFTMVVSGKFIAEFGDVMMRGPKTRDFQIEAVRRGVVESKYGLYLGVGTFVVGASALTGGAFLGTMLAPGGGLATGGALSGGGLLGGGIGQSTRAVGTYLYLNAPQLYGSAMLYGGAALTGIALGSHVEDIRAEGLHWRDVPRFAEDLTPLVGGYAESSSMRLGGGGRNAPEPPTEDLGSTGGSIGAPTIKGSLPSPAQPVTSGSRQVAGLRPPGQTDPIQPAAPEPQILTTITPSRPVSGFARAPAPQPEPVPLTPGQTVFTEMPRAKVVQGNQPTYGSVAPAFETPGQEIIPPSRRVTGFQPPRRDIAETGNYVEREMEPGQYVAREHFGDVNPLTGEAQPRYYVNVKLDEHGMMDSDFVLREGGRRSGSLFGKSEFLQAKQYFEQKTGPGSVKGAYGRWSGGDNLDSFNTRYKIATDKGFSPDEALIEAARRTKTGEWARSAGFTKVNVTKADGQPGAFTNVEVEFTTEVQPAVAPPTAPTGVGQSSGTTSQSGGPGSTPATQLPPAQVIPSSPSSTGPRGTTSYNVSGIRRDQPAVATAGKGPPGGEPKGNVPAPGQQSTEAPASKAVPGTESEPVPEPVADAPTGRIGEGTPGEVVGDYRLQGDAGRQGETFVRRILGITRIRPITGGQRFRPLFESFIDEARTNNARTLRVTIEAIRNERVLRNVAEIQEWIQSLGGTVTLPDLETVEITIPL